MSSRAVNTAFAQDCGIAAYRLDEAVTLCDRAQDYLSIKLANDPRASALAAEMREFIERVELFASGVNAVGVERG